MASGAWTQEELREEDRADFTSWKIDPEQQIRILAAQVARLTERGGGTHTKRK